MSNSAPYSIFLVLTLALDAGGTDATSLGSGIRSDGSVSGGTALNFQVRNLNLSTRAKTILSRMGVVTVEDLVQQHAKEILKEQHCGRGTVAEIEKELEELSLHLGTTI